MQSSELPAITVVTPSLNQGKFIRATIQSVLDQNYPALEYLILDGGSTDETAQVLDSFGDRLNWSIEKDRGQTEAINKGWHRSTGEIVTWLNSDDIYYPEALNHVGGFLKNHPEVDIVYGNCDYIDHEGKFIRAYPTQRFDFEYLVRSTINYIPQPATFIRHRVLERLGYLDESLNYIMDFDYWLRAGVEHNIVFSPVRLAALRIHDEAKSIAKLAGFAEELIKVYQRFFELPDLPDVIRSSSRKAMENIYYRASDCAFWANDLKKSRQYAKQAWSLNPFRIRRLWLYLLLGGYGRNLAEKTVGNPYLIRAQM